MLNCPGSLLGRAQRAGCARIADAISAAVAQDAGAPASQALDFVVAGGEVVAGIATGMNGVSVIAYWPAIMVAWLVTPKAMNPAVGSSGFDEVPAVAALVPQSLAPCRHWSPAIQAT